MSTLSELIKSNRLKKGFSKRKLAEIAGVSHTEIHRIENGERKNPSALVLRSIANALDIDNIDIMASAGYIDKLNIDIDTKLLVEAYQSLSSTDKIDVCKYIDFLRSKNNY